jgi:hypothetical protein
LKPRDTCPTSSLPEKVLLPAGLQPQACDRVLPARAVARPAGRNHPNSSPPNHGRRGSIEGDKTAIFGDSGEDAHGTAEQISAGATAALRDGMRERRRREWCDREGQSSVFQRKIRSRSRLLAPHVHFGGAWYSGRCLIPALRNPSGNALGAMALRSLASWYELRPATTRVARLMIIPI